MAKSCVVVADAGRARFFYVQEADVDQLEGGPGLVQEREWTHPEGQQGGKELFDNLKSGRKRAAHGGPAHGLDDHRERHEREIERRYAEKLAESIGALVREHGAGRLVMVADPRLLGLLREPLAEELPEPVDLQELAEDLSGHSVPHIEEVLVRRGVLPERTRPPGATYQPRGAGPG